MTPLLRRWGLLCILAGISLLTFYNLDSLPSVYGRPGTPSRVAQITGKLESGFQWKEVPDQYPVKSPMTLPTGAPKDLPRIQFKFKKETASQKVTRERRKDEVKEVFVRSWNAYKEHAWLHDEIMPISGGSKDTFGGWGASLVDALDMLAIVGMEDEIKNATAELDKIDFNSSGQRDLNIFETTIRYLGGFLAAYDLTDGKYPVLLDKAIDLGEMLYKAFDTPNRMPITRWDWLNTGQGGKQEAPYSCLVAEIASLSLEFTRLSQLSGDPKYYDAIQRISNVMAEQQDDTVIPGLWPIMVSPGDMDFTTDVAFTLGGMADSAYEYLPKEHMLLGGLSDQSKGMYIKAFEASKKSLFFRAMNPENRDILISGTARASGRRSVHLNPEAQHLTCFAGGMVGLGARLFDREGDMKIAKQLTEGCIWAYEAMPAGIMPEIFHAVRCDDDSEEYPNCKWSDEAFYHQLGNHAAFDSDEDLKEQAEEYLRDSGLIPGMVKMTDRRYILRPEAIESVFYLYRMTGDTDYQDHAWRMFKAITKLTETKYSYAALSDVSDPKGFKYDSQESFWMAETLKYFYLIFSEPDLVSLDEYVFNTEAHPLRRPRTGQEDLWDLPEGRKTR